MIELFEGVPGSGKSYYAVAEKFLPAVRAGRRIYIYVDGIYLDRLATFTGMPLSDLEHQVTVWRDPQEVLSLHRTVEPQALVIVDEAQTVFRAFERADKALLRWLETHRHHGVDVLLCCQDYRQVSSAVTRLVEATIKFRKLAMVGLQRHSQAKVRGNPEDEEVIRTFTITYRPTVYAYYASYAAAAIREERRRHSIWKSASVATGLAACLFALGIFLWKPWTSLESAAQAGLVRLPEPAATGATPRVPAGPRPSLVPSSLPAVAPPAGSEPTRRVVRVQGVFAWETTPPASPVWRYLLATGETLTASEIAGRYGLAVLEVQDGRFPRLLGEGVVYDTGRD